MATNDLQIQYGALTFDLAGMHTPNLLTRVREALRIGIGMTQTGAPHLRDLLATLTVLSRTTPVRFFTNPQEWLPGSGPARYPALTTWTSSATTQPRSVDEIRATRSAVRVFMQDLGDSFAGTLETTWHELLHPTVPFTHPQDGLPSDVLVDYPKWIGAIYGIKGEMPKEVTDPITGQKESTDYTWSMNKPFCIHCKNIG